MDRSVNDLRLDHEQFIRCQRKRAMQNISEPQRPGWNDIGTLLRKIDEMNGAAKLLDDNAHMGADMSDYVIRTVDLHALTAIVE